MKKRGYKPRPITPLFLLVPLARLERATCGLGIRRSIHLSYRGNPDKFMILFLFRQGVFFTFLDKRGNKRIFEIYGRNGFDG